MLNYIGVRCPVCGKKFAEPDDIVVCPACGAPHHRDCYILKNQCAFAADHLSGKEWRDPAGKPPPDQDRESSAKVCSRCGSSSPRENIFCQVCGFPLTLPSDDRQDGQDWFFCGGQGVQVDAISMTYGGLDPEDRIDGELVRDIASYVGGGSAYYLPRFQAISGAANLFMLNFCAFIFNFFYFFYRKMYWVGGILLALTVVGGIPSYLYAREVTLPVMLQDFGFISPVQIDYATADHYLWLGNIARMINTAVGLIFSLFSNRIYYNKVIGEVHDVRSAAVARDPDASYSEALSRAGGVNKIAVVIVAASLFALSLALGMAMTYEYFSAL